MQGPISGLYHFFDVTARVTIGTTEYLVWAHLSAEHMSDIRPADVTYEQIIAGSPKVVCSVGFMWNDPKVPEPRNRRIPVGPPLAMGQCDWQWHHSQWRIDCPVDTAPPNDTQALWQLAKGMIAAVLAPSFGSKADDVEVVILKDNLRFLYFNPDGP